MKARLFVAFVPAVAAAFLLNCGDADICEGPQCAPGNGDGGLDASHDAAADATVTDGGAADGAPADAKPNTDSAPAGCNTAADVSSQAACATDAFALFVDGNSGNDSGAGTKESPYRSITRAVAAGGKSAIFICAASYSETVSLTAPVSLYGGFGCAGGVWSYTAAKTTVGTTGAAGATALTITGTSMPITIEDLDFEAADQSAIAGGTSIGALVSNATGLVTFNRVTLHAGAGGTGANGVLTTVTFPDATTLQGQNGTATDGGAQVKVLCPAGGTTIGGAGGASGDVGSPGQPDGGAGGVAGVCNIGIGVGSDGTTGIFGSMGAGATAAGAIGASGWNSSAGTDGGAGAPGSGGGGGFGQDNGGGGSGGAGGCGGQGGGGGSSGGSSIALLCSTSSVSVLASIFTASDGGAGGAGAAGQSGQSPGGFRGLGYAESTACNGGNGGAGGAGGSGGGGAGGDSLAVAYSPTMPSLDSASTANAKVGSPGSAGTGGSAHVNDGTPGVATTTPTKF